jgi:hypothetical protein
LRPQDIDVNRSGGGLGPPPLPRPSWTEQGA